jgi:hypothetical protein
LVKKKQKIILCIKEERRKYRGSNHMDMTKKGGGERGGW